MHATAESLEEGRDEVVPGTHLWPSEPVGLVWNLRRIDLRDLKSDRIIDGLPVLINAGFIGTSSRKSEREIELPLELCLREFRRAERLLEKRKIL